MPCPVIIVLYSEWLQSLVLARLATQRIFRMNRHHGIEMRVALLLAAALALRVPCAAQRVRFEGSLPGKLPSGWTVAMTHDGGAPKWNTLRIVLRGSLFAVSFNSERSFETQDQTFRGTVRTGLWTKADSVTYFDDFEAIGK